MKLFFILLLFSCFIIKGLAQAALNPNGVGNLSPYIVSQMGFDNRYQGIKGTPFLFDKWQEGKVMLVKQDTFSVSLQLNIDLVNSAVTILLPNGAIGQIQATHLKKIQVKDANNQLNEWIVAFELEIEGTDNARQQIYQVLKEGHFTLLKSTQKRLQKADYKGAYNVGNKFDEFVTETTYWLREGDEPYQKIKLKRKALEEALPKHTASMEKIIKTQRLDLTYDMDVIQLLKALE